MSFFKRVAAAFLAISSMTVLPSVAQAVPINVTFSTTISALAGAITGVATGNTWTLSFVVDNFEAVAPGQELIGQTWNGGDVLGSVVGTSSDGYTATYGGTGLQLTLATDAGGIVNTVIFDDLNISGNSDSQGAGDVVHSVLGFVSSNAFAFLTDPTTTVDAWTLEVADTGGQNGGSVLEPGALALLGAGLLGLGLLRRRRGTAR